MHSESLVEVLLRRRIARLRSHKSSNSFLAHLPSILITYAPSPSSKPSTLQRDYAVDARANVYSYRPEYTVSLLSTFPPELQHILRSYGMCTTSVHFDAGAIMISITKILILYNAGASLTPLRLMPSFQYKKKRSYGTMLLPALVPALRAIYFQTHQTQPQAVMTRHTLHSFHIEAHKILA